MHIRLFQLASFALMSGIAAASQAACLDEQQIDALAAHYRARTPATVPQTMGEADADCTRAKFDARLRAELGPVIGFKVALTSQAMQKRFGTDQPVWGRFYRGMLLPHGATVDAGFGARPRFEADLLVRVGSDAINQARTLDDVVASIDQVIPFIELPDLIVDTPEQLTAHSLSAVNAGARSGVMGEAITVPQDAEARRLLLDDLRDMHVVISDGNGARLGEGRGSDMLDGHPLWSLVWLAASMARQNRALRPGDIVSLGSFSPLLQPRPGLVGTVTYDGLTGAKPVTVRFR